MTMGSPEVLVEWAETDAAAVSELGSWAAALLVTLGAEVLAELARFSRAADPGAMITIKRTRDGLTAQVTGAIVSGSDTTLSMDSIQRIASLMNGDDSIEIEAAIGGLDSTAVTNGGRKHPNKEMGTTTKENGHGTMI